MSTKQQASVLQHVREWVQTSQDSSLTDRDLLQLYVHQNDEQAFSLLVQRHTAMVWGVCRRTLHDNGLAEDAFQATFVALFQQATSTRWRESVAGWLYRVAHRNASKIRSVQRDQVPAEEDLTSLASAPEKDDVSWREVREILEREVRGLPARYRDPVVLCYFEGKSNSEAARQLGWSKGALSGRLARARALLRRRLEKRGVEGGALALLTAWFPTDVNATIQVPAPEVVPASVLSKTSHLTSHALEIGARGWSISMMAKLSMTVLFLGSVLVGGAGLFLADKPASATSFQKQAPKAAPPEQTKKAVEAGLRWLAEKQKPDPKPPLRERLYFRHGGTEQAKKAIEKGLKWIAAQQTRNGSWPVAIANEKNGYGVAATCFALEPFLAEGHLPGKKTRTNPYGKVIQKGLNYLLRAQDQQGAFPGTLYVQGIATTTLCRAYGSTRDPVHKKAAQLALNYVVDAQHNAGGWRYAPGQPGDTSVTIWQLTGFHSAQLAGLHAPRATLARAGVFLNNCEDPQGGYGYVGPRASPTMTAAGLLGRVYLGWNSDHPSFQKGLERLRQFGNQKNNLYHTYFHNDLFYHVGGTTWTKWFPTIREGLIRTQKQNGSWAFQNDRFCRVIPVMGTSLAVQILQTPIRMELPVMSVPTKPAEPKELEQIWNDLGTGASHQSRHGVWRLVAIPKQAVPFLRKRWIPVQGPKTDTKEIVRLIRQLDSSKFTEREEATEKLMEMDIAIAPTLREALKKTSSLEIRTRLTKVLNKLMPKDKSRETRQLLRMVEILEWIDNKSSHRLLKQMAKQAQSESVSQAAADALQRLMR